MTDKIYYTLASAVLSGAADPYDSQTADAWKAGATVARREAALRADKDVGWIYTASKSIAMSMPFVGILNGIFDAIGEAVSRMSSGGFDGLSVLTKQRIYLYLPGWGAKKPTKFTSQARDGVAVLGDSYHLPPTQSTIAMSDAEYAKALRNYLIKESADQELRRITLTPDEVSPPRGVINLLYGEQLWPPPIEPMPITKAEWRGKMAEYQSYYSYNPDALLDTARMELSRKVYAQLYAEYERDCKVYAESLAQFDLQWTDALLEQARKYGMLPRLGSPGNPAITLPIKE